MDIRNSTNRMLGTTPGEALFGRLLHTRVPSYSPPIIVNPEHQVRAKARMAADHDAKRGVHFLPRLQAGDLVTLQDGCSDPSKQWRVVEQYGQQVGVSDGRRILLRNRRHVREYTTVAKDEERDVPLPATQSAERSTATFTVPSPPSSTVPASSSPDGQSASTASTGSRSHEVQGTPATTEAPGTTTDLQLSPNTATGLQGGNIQSSASGTSVYTEGRVTRSGRLVKLTERAKEADI